MAISKASRDDLLHPERMISDACSYGRPRGTRSKMRNKIPRYFLIWEPLWPSLIFLFFRKKEVLDVIRSLSNM